MVGKNVRITLMFHISNFISKYENFFDEASKLHIYYHCNFSIYMYILKMIILKVIVNVECKKVKFNVVWFIDRSALRSLLLEVDNDF